MKNFFTRRTSLFLTLNGSIGLRLERAYRYRIEVPLLGQSTSTTTQPQSQAAFTGGFILAGGALRPSRVFCVSEPAKAYFQISILPLFFCLGLLFVEGGHLDAAEFSVVP